MRAYPAVGKRRWRVAIEFHDGTRIEGVDDQDVFDRWRRLSEWGDRSPDTRDEWLFRILSHASVVYGVDLTGLGPWTAPEDIIDRMFATGCLVAVQRHPVNLGDEVDGTTDVG